MYSATGLFLDVGFSVAERVLYVPSIGYCMLLIALLDWLIEGPEVAESHTSSNKDAKESDASTHHPQTRTPSRFRTIGLVLAIALIALYSARFESLKLLCGCCVSPCVAGLCAAMSTGKHLLESSALRSRLSLSSFVNFCLYSIPVCAEQRPDALRGGQGCPRAGESRFAADASSSSYHC